MIVMMIRDISLIILSFLAAIMLTFNLFENNNKKRDNDPPLPKINGRKFEGIVVEYPPAELCIYPEYRGKPYFSIKYEENGEHIIGYGTYNQDVLSRFLQEYFIIGVINREAESEDIEFKEEWRIESFDHEGFYNFLLNTIQPNEMEKYRSMFLSNGEIVN